MKLMTYFADVTVQCERDVWAGQKNERNTSRIVDELVEHFGRHSELESVATTSAVEYFVQVLKERGNSGPTINRKLSVLSKIFSYARARGMLDAAPFIPRQRENPGRTRVFSEAEWMKLRCHFSKPDDVSMAFIVLMETGCRLSECLSLKREDIQPSFNVLIFRDTKNGTDRVLPLTEKLVSLAPFLGNFDMTPETVRRAWHSAREKLGLGEDAKIHTIRHTVATRLVQRGVPIPVVQKWMGHKSIAMTLRYTHLSTQDLEVAAKALE